jgi:GNAT superfamily N-acetyltransferase
MGLLSAKPNAKSPALLRNNGELFHHYRRKLTRNFKDYGWLVSFKKAVAYLFQPFYQKVTYYLYELDINKYIRQGDRNSKYVFRLIRHDEKDLIHQVEKMEEWLSGSLTKKLQHNCLCMVVLDGDSVIGFNYAAIGTGEIPLLKLRVITGPTEAWSEQITISSDYRRQGLASALRNHFYRELRARGITTLYGHRQEFNLASKQAARKYTLDVMLRVEYKRILGIHRLKCSKSADHHYQGQAQKHESQTHFYIRPHRAKRAKGSDEVRRQPGVVKFMVPIEDLK